jgi:hypothetical protein
MTRIFRNVANLVNHGGFWWFTGWLITPGDGECDGNLYDGPIQLCADTVEAFESEYVYRRGDLDGTWTYLGAGQFNDASGETGCVPSR